MPYYQKLGEGGATFQVAILASWKLAPHFSGRAETTI